MVNALGGGPLAEFLLIGVKNRGEIRGHERVAAARDALRLLPHDVDVIRGALHAVLGPEAALVVLLVHPSDALDAKLQSVLVVLRYGAHLDEIARLDRALHLRRRPWREPRPWRLPESDRDTPGPRGSGAPRIRGS